MANDLLLDFRERQAGDMDISIESEADGPIRPHQALTGDRPARSCLEHLDEQEVRRLDDQCGPDLFLSALRLIPDLMSPPGPRSEAVAVGPSAVEPRD